MYQIIEASWGFYDNRNDITLAIRGLVTAGILNIKVKYEAGTILGDVLGCDGCAKDLFIRLNEVGTNNFQQIRVQCQTGSNKRTLTIDLNTGILVGVLPVTNSNGRHDPGFILN